MQAVFNPNKRIAQLTKQFFVLGCLILLSACSRPTVLEKIEQEGVLHVITRNAPNTYFEDRDGPAGFEYELAESFAEYLGVSLKMRIAEDHKEIFDVLENEYAHFAAAGLSRAAAKTLNQAFRFSPSFLQVKASVLYRKGSVRPKSLDDLIGKKILTPALGAHSAILTAAKASKLPNLQWESNHDLENVDLIRLIHEGEVDAVIVNSNEYELHQAMFPRAQVAFSLKQPLELSWIFPPGEDATLVEKAKTFFREIKNNGTLAHIEERYYGHVKQLNYVGARTFIKHIKQRLPKFDKDFKENAGKHDLDWRLIAAIGYQESHWRPYAASPTGVRGLMMLTLSTAREMRVKNRLNPKQSIIGGARYFAKMRGDVDEEVTEPDRTWMALAAYNVGMGHLEDARIITRNNGFDPKKWADVKKHLPLLQQKKWYSKTKHGYARGWEPVHYVQNIRRYYDVLTWMTRPSVESGAVAENSASTKEINRVKENPQMPAPFRITPPML